MNEDSLEQSKDIKPTVFMDTEVYPNWCCIIIKSDGEYYEYEHTDNKPLNVETATNLKHWTTHQNAVIVGFNSRSYDDIIVQLIMRGESTKVIHQISIEIIEVGKSPWDICGENAIQYDPFDSIDLRQIMPMKLGLKLYGARSHSKKLQELPIDPHKKITLNQSKTLLQYCRNDVDVTEEQFHLMDGELQLREEMGEMYGLDLRSSGGASIAASVLGKEYEKLSNKAPTKPGLEEYKLTEFKYQTPKWIAFRTPEYQALLQDIEQDVFKLNPNSGHLILGDSVKNRIVRLQDCSAKMGIGGLHSVDGAGYYESDEEYCIVDFDVASHYPSMIINSGWYPRHLGPEFLTTYKSIVDKRLAAKKAGDKLVANSLKLVINSSFGLFSNQYSILYDPNLLLNVTLSGQLSLLMLAERLEAEGFFVISANTDGVVVNPPRSKLNRVKEIVAEFEKDTGLVMEDTYYRLYVRTNVNNYFTVMEDNSSMKSKGLFQAATVDLQHNPTGNIITKAVVARMRNGTPIKDIILNCTDLRDFMVVRTVKGGAVKDTKPIGKIIRWYWSTSTDTAIHYATNNNTVPKSQCGMPLMDLPGTLPKDINYDIYIEEAEKLLSLVNVKCVPGRNHKVNKYIEMGLSIVPADHTGVRVMEQGYDYSAVPALAIQTGHRANTLAIEGEDFDTLTMGGWSFFNFGHPAFPTALATVEKKFGRKIRYGQAIPMTEEPKGRKSPLSNFVYSHLINSMGLPQKRKLFRVDNLEFLL